MTTCSIARRADAKTRFTALLLATTLTSTLIAPAAFAQEQPQAENVAAARSLGLQGIKLADAGDCKGAIEKLSRAESLYHAPSILGRLGECQVNVGQIVVGTENLNRVVREELAPNAPKAFRDAQTRAKGVLNTALPKIAHLTVKVDPPDAKPSVTVAGSPIPAALLGAERPTDPGTHEVIVTAPGYLQQKSSVTLTEGASQELTLKLQKDPSALAETPPPAPAPVVVAPPPAPPSDTSPKKNNTLAYVALGVGGAGLIVGGVTGFLALGKKSDLEGCEGKRCPSDQESTLDSAKSLATVSTVGFAVGFVGVGAGIVLLLTGNSSNSASTAAPKVAHQGLKVHPWFGGNSAGLNGTF
ncbi:MAG: hypothetical protein EOO73_17790 [Myxococcales bacterium]|nr:MAG: hypothetical protein EOO73_17790 [Myxococcales bacterium]